MFNRRASPSFNVVSGKGRETASQPAKLTFPTGGEASSLWTPSSPWSRRRRLGATRGCRWHEAQRDVLRTPFFELARRRRWSCPDERSRRRRGRNRRRPARSPSSSVSSVEETLAGSAGGRGAVPAASGGWRVKLLPPHCSSQRRSRQTRARVESVRKGRFTRALINGVGSALVPKTRVIEARRARVRDFACVVAPKPEFADSDAFDPYRARRLRPPYVRLAFLRSVRDHKERFTPLLSGFARLRGSQLHC